MKHLRIAFAAGVMGAVLGAAHMAQASQDNPPPPAAPNLTGLHAFDLRVGEWTCHNRKLKERLTGSHEWVEFDGAQSFRLLIDGYANVDENVFNISGGGSYKGVTLRAYDPKTGEWAIWWLDGRNPFGELDPPVKGRFQNGIGIFYADDTLRGKPVRVRFTWSNITENTAHWEQAFSPDGGKTWEVNWITDFKRAAR
jgi:hypothetical protein